MAPWEEYQAAAAAGPTPALKPWEEYAAADTDTLPEVAATQSESGNGFLAKVNAALRKPSPYEGLRNFEESTRENIMAMAPHDLTSYLESIYPAAGAARHAVDLGRQLLHGDVSGIPLVGRGPEIVAADETPAFSKERIGTAERTVMDLLTLAGAGEGSRVPLRAEPLVKPTLDAAGWIRDTLSPETQALFDQKLAQQGPPLPQGYQGPGTIAGDVSRALERRFTLQEPPPEPPLAPAPPIEDTLANIPKEPPVFNPELGPQTIPEFPMPLQTEGTQQLSPIQRNGQILNKRQELLTRQKELKQRFIAGDHGVAPELEAVEAQINNPVTNPVVHAPVEQRVQHGEFAKPGYTAVDTPPEGPVNAPGGATVAREAPGGVPVAEPAPAHLATKEQVVAGHPELLYNPDELSPGTLASRGWRGVPGSSPKVTVVGDEFFNLQPVERQALLTHELGHDVAAKILADPTWTQLMEPLRIQDGSPLSVRSKYSNPVGVNPRPEEILSDIHEEIVKRGMPKFDDPREWSPETAAKLKPIYEAVAKAAEPPPPVAPEPYTQEAAAQRAAQGPQKPSKIGQSIEAKAVEAKLTKGFPETAGYDPITIKDQAARASNLVENNPAHARSIVRGEAPLPPEIKGTSLITAMEEHLVRNPDPHVAHELANSRLVSLTSEAAQEMRLMSERVPDGITTKFAEIKAAREAGAKLRNETPAKVKAEINGEVVKAASKRPTWEQFVNEIVC